MHELDPAARQPPPRAASLRDRPHADQLPELAQAHRELLLGVDQHRHVIVAKPPAQLRRHGDLAEAGSENDAPGHQPTQTGAGRAPSPIRS
jgi:hypothetical protein